MASQWHMACKTSNPAKNIGGKNPLLAKTSAKSRKLQAPAPAQNPNTIEESNNLNGNFPNQPLEF